MSQNILGRKSTKPPENQEPIDIHFNSNLSHFIEYMDFSRIENKDKKIVREKIKEDDNNFFCNANSLDLEKLKKITENSILRNSFLELDMEKNIFSKIDEDDYEEFPKLQLKKKLFANKDFQPETSSNSELKEKIKEMINRLLNTDEISDSDEDSSSIETSLSPIDNKTSNQSNSKSTNTEYDDNFILEQCMLDISPADKEIPQNFTDIITNKNYEERNVADINKITEKMTKTKILNDVLLESEKQKKNKCYTKKSSIFGDDNEYYKRLDSNRDVENGELASFVRQKNIPQNAESFEFLPKCDSDDEEFDQNTYDFFDEIANNIKDYELKNKIKLILDELVYVEPKLNKPIFTNSKKNYILNCWKDLYFQKIRKKQIEEISKKKKKKDNEEDEKIIDKKNRNYSIKQSTAPSSSERRSLISQGSQMNDNSYYQNKNNSKTHFNKIKKKSCIIPIHEKLSSTNITETFKKKQSQNLENLIAFSKKI